jgi:hypothetical protein
MEGEQRERVHYCYWGMLLPLNKNSAELVHSGMWLRVCLLEWIRAMLMHFTAALQTGEMHICL